MIAATDDSGVDGCRSVDPQGIEVHAPTCDDRDIQLAKVALRVFPVFGKILDRQSTVHDENGGIGR
jgi:hypothetical protein